MQIKRILIGGVIVVALLSLPLALGLSREGWRLGGAEPRAVAVVELVGVISDVVEKGLGQTQGIGFLLDNLTDARESSDIAAVVVRINSGGGSAASSQEIHRAIGKVKKAGKPVVASMGDVAASGGYYAAVAADRILANPSTITGSIGVIAQFINVAELAEEFGVELETVKTGPYKDIGNPTRPFTQDERRVLQALVDDSLDQFVSAVAVGRDLAPQVVRDLADGRVYTGRQAKELGLIDGFGGLEEAVDLAAELAGIEGEPEVFEYSEPEPWFRRYLGFSVPNADILRARVERELIKRLYGQGSGLTLRY